MRTSEEFTSGRRGSKGGVANPSGANGCPSGLLLGGSHLALGTRGRVPCWNSVRQARPLGETRVATRRRRALLLATPDMEAYVKVDQGPVSVEGVQRQISALQALWPARRTARGTLPATFGRPPSSHPASAPQHGMTRRCMNGCHGQVRGFDPLLSWGWFVRAQVQRRLGAQVLRVRDWCQFDVPRFQVSLHRC